MITLQQFFELIEFKINDGQPYGWSCFGPNAYIISVDENPSASASIVFDTKTQEVYEVDVHDYINNRSYRLMNSKFQKAYLKEAKSRKVNPNEAYDNVNFIDLELTEDYLEKASAILMGQDYDTNILVPLEFEEYEMNQILELANAQGLTPEQYLSKLIQDNQDEFIEIAKKLSAQEKLNEVNDEIVKEDQDDEVHHVSPSAQLSFDLEQQLMDCWSIVDDIQTLLEGVLDREMSKDEISNVLIGLKPLYQLKFEKAFETFEKVHRVVCLKKM